LTDIRVSDSWMGADFDVATSFSHVQARDLWRWG
jgi:hypothetical protein